ncbi:MAG: hypothetical protein K6U87_07480 [Firmicutes bacterium]|nr:hypothetical protein [Bacillota bacterium]
MPRVAALWKLFRPLPTLVWGIPAVLVGAALAPRPWPPDSGLALATTVTGAALAQGILAHAWNDLTDEATGTDHLPRGGLSGGSGVLADGQLTAPQLQQWAQAGVAVYLLLALAGVWLRGAPAALASAVGLFGAWSYSRSPLRLAYRPGAGEWGAIFPAFAAAVWAGAIAAGSPWSVRPLFGAAIEGAFCAASVLHNHLLDLDADWQAIPRKVTTPAWWYHVLHRDPREPVWLAAALTAGIAVAGALQYPPFWGSAWAIGVAGTLVIFGGPLPPGPQLRRRDLAFKALGLLQATWLLASTLR